MSTLGKACLKLNQRGGIALRGLKFRTRVLLVWVKLILTKFKNALIRVCVSVCIRVCICVSAPLFSMAVKEQLCGVRCFSFSFNLQRSLRNLELRHPDLPSAISLVPKINTVRSVH